MGQPPLEIIATTDRRKATAPFLIAGALNLWPAVVLILVLWLDRLHDFERVTNFDWFIRSILIGSSLGGALRFARVIRALTEKGLAVDGEYFIVMGRNAPLVRIHLNNIGEVQVRADGTPRHMYMDRGLALVLHRPVFLDHRGRENNLRPKMCFRRFNCHYITSPSYHESIEKIARSLAIAVSRTQGVEMPVTVVRRGEKLPAIARPVPAAQAAPAPGVEDAAPLGTECIECGYDLRHINLDARCPECGTPVRRSLAGQSLSHAPWDWVVSLALGAGALGLSGVGALVAAWIFRGGVGTYPFGSPAMNRTMLVATLMTVVAMASLWIGALLLTRPEPVIRRTTSDPPTRRVIRVLLAAPLALAAIAFLRVNPIFIVGLPVIWAMVIAGLCLWYARHLMPRLQRHGWAIVARVGAVECLCTALVMLVFGCVLTRIPRPAKLSPVATQIALRPAAELNDENEHEDSEDAAAAAEDDPEESDPSGQSPSSVPISGPASTKATREKIGANVLFVLYAPAPFITAMIFLFLAFWMLQAAREHDLRKSATARAARNISAGRPPPQG